MTRRKPYGVTPLENDGVQVSDRTIAVIRYDGDPDVFTALAHDHLRREGRDETIEPPRPRLYRWNVDPTRYYDQVLGEAATPGPGVWTGAILECARRPGAGPEAEAYCWLCDARRGERHHADCAAGRQMVRKVAA